MTERTRWHAIAEELAEAEKPAELKINVVADESIGVDEVIVRNGDSILYTRPKFDFEKSSKVRWTTLLTVEGVLVGPVLDFKYIETIDPVTASSSFTASFRLNDISLKLIGKDANLFVIREDETICFQMHVIGTMSNWNNRTGDNYIDVRAVGNVIETVS